MRFVSTFTGLPRLHTLYLKLRDPDWLLTATNQLDQAYYRAVGKPEWHEPITREQTNRIAEAAVSLIATFKALELLAYQRQARSSEEVEAMVIDILEAIVEGGLTAKEQFMLNLMSNTTWTQTLYFLPIEGESPYENTFRQAWKVNLFTGLSQEKVELDQVLTKVAAQLFLEVLCSTTE